ncbi:MAG: DnaD domain protein [Bacilli bacterium]|nr:DnaD domain protein [Bacilli bacterium]MBR2997693.1 DnaD domain protein [Bacilli bacterium]
MISVLPADTYTVINKSIITDTDKKIISILYQPIIGYSAVSLYYTLLDDLDKSLLLSNEVTHHHLMATMQLGLKDILEAREKLEAIGLLKTYLKKDSINQYVYCLYSPISYNEFFNHPILNIVLYNNLGKKEYEKVLNYFKIPRINLKDFEDITCSFDQVFKSVRGNELEIEEDIQRRESNNIILSKDIDFNVIMETIPKGQISDKCFNEDTKELIKQLSFVYDLDTLDLQGLVRNSINEKGMIDKALLRKSCRDYYKFDNYGNLPTLIYNRQPEFLKKPKGDNSKWAKMVYTFENITPYQLLRAKYNGAEPTDRDKRLIENLLIDQKLNPGVVNVLISYVLKTNNQLLTKSYVETIAGQWKRLGIETVEDAMKLTEKEYKKTHKKKDNKVVNNKKKNSSDIPSWFNQDNNVEETSLEEKMELENILKELV